MYPIDIIGIGQGKKDLTQAHLDLIQDCDVLVGGVRHLAMFDNLDNLKIPVKGPVKALAQTLEEQRHHKKIVVLASGDPLFYGIGTSLMRFLDRDGLQIHSNISSVAAGFAAIKEPWHDATIISLHGKKHTRFSYDEIAQASKIAFLTDPKNTPNDIAQGLIKHGIAHFKLCVLECLGNKALEKITWFNTPEHVGEQDFCDPNIVILIHSRTQAEKPCMATHMGMEDSQFRHSKGLITKSEIRSISLSKLKLTHKPHVLWDIGAGSGSVGIEAALQIPQGQVFAIEKHPERIFDIQHNVQCFGCANVTLVQADFPEQIETLPRPDRIFIGGGGKNLEQVMEKACDRLVPSGTIVINTVLLQTLDVALQRLKAYKFNPSVVQIQVSRSRGMPFGDRLEALNPVWIISGTKP